jgi:hypothetical protein
MKLLLFTAHREGEIGRGKNRLARLLAECRQVRRVWWRLIMAILIVVLIISQACSFFVKHHNRQSSPQFLLFLQT